MSSVSVYDDHIAIAFTTAEKVAGLVRDQTVLLDDVVRVSVEPEASARPRGWRAPGFALPGVARIGTWRRKGERQLVCVRRGQPALRIDAIGESFDSYLVSTPHAAALADGIRRAIAAN